MDHEAGAGSSVHKEKLHTEPVINDPRYIIMLSVIVLIITILVWWLFSRRRSSRDALLLLGLSEAGKTLLFARLIYTSYRRTYTSMQENVASFTTNKRTLDVVDIPGQERLRNKFFDQFKSQARAILFLVDSVTIQKEIRDVAEYLYTILSDKVIEKSRPSVLIVCNKQDQPLAKGSQVIQSLLEKELNVVRLTKSSQLQSVDPSQPNTVAFLGKRGKDFEFSHLGYKVEFAECAALNDTEDNPVDIEAVEKWVMNL